MVQSMPLGSSDEGKYSRT